MLISLSLSLFVSLSLCGVCAISSEVCVVECVFCSQFFSVAYCKTSAHFVCARVRERLCACAFFNTFGGAQMPWEEEEGQADKATRVSQLSSKVKKQLKEKLINRHKQLAADAKQ